MSRSEAARFAARTQPTSDGSGCVLWTGAMSFWSSAHRRLMSPRRWLWEHRHGTPVPEDEIVRATCGNKRCVAEDHFYLVWKGTRSETHCSRGHAMDAEAGYWTPSGSWVCRECKRDYMRKVRRDESFRRRQSEYSSQYRRRNPEKYQAKLAKKRQRYAEDPEYRQQQLDNARRSRERKKTTSQREGRRDG